MALNKQKTAVEAIANPTPARLLSVFNPTTSPHCVNSGPPLLPGLMGASVCT